MYINITIRKSGWVPFSGAAGARRPKTIVPLDLDDSLQRTETFYREVRDAGMLPLSAGGDHLITLPIMRAIASERPVGMVHFDAHPDTNDRCVGEHRLTYGTAFRRALEEYFGLGAEAVIAEAQRRLRGPRGVNLTGGDVVEVAPPFDPSGATALVGARLMYEILRLLAEIVAKQ